MNGFRTAAPSASVWSSSYSKLVPASDSSG